MLLIIWCLLWLGPHCVITQINADKCLQDRKNMLPENTVNISPKNNPQAILEEVNGSVNNLKHLRKAD